MHGRVSAAINRACSELVIHGNRVCRDAPTVNHLLFADDSLLFCRSTPEECTNLKQLLDDYERVFGQAINYAKFGIYFSKNVTDDRREEIKTVMGVQNALNTGHYLGLPSLVGRSKRDIFSYIKDRLWKKLQGWKNQKLSKVGKEILIKTAA